jgi:exopolysaccharide production protein ExoQ
MTVLVGAVGAPLPVKAALTVLLALFTFWLARRNRAAAVATTVFFVACGSSSVIWVKYTFLTVRWGPLIALALAVFLTRRRDLHLRSVHLVVLAMLLLAFASAGWSITPSLTLQRAVSFSVLLVLVLLLAEDARGDPARFAALREAIAWLAPVIVVLSLLTLAFQPDRAVRAGQFRGFLENPNALGLFVAFAYPFMYAALDARWPSSRWIVLLAVPAVVLIVVSAARSGLLAILVALIGYEVSRRQTRRLALHLCLVVGIVLIAFLASVAIPDTSQNGTSPYLLNRAADVSFVSALTGARNEAWSATAHFIAQRPFLGFGFGTGDQVFAHYPDQVHFRLYEGALPENAYLQLVMELGLLGAVLFLIPLFAGAIRAAGVVRRGARNLSEAAFGALLLAAIPSIAVEGVLEAAGAPWAFMIWLAVAAALAWPPGDAVVASDLPEPLERRPLPRPLRFGAAHPLVASALAALVVLGVALLVSVIVKGGRIYTREEALAAGHSLARTTCRNATCVFGAVRRESNPIWQVQLNHGQYRFSCLLVDLRSFDPKHPRASAGVTPVACSTLPLRRTNVLTIAIPRANLAVVSPDAAYLHAAFSAITSEMGVPAVRFVAESAGPLSPHADGKLAMTPAEPAPGYVFTRPYSYVHFVVVARPGRRFATMEEIRRTPMGVYRPLSAAFARSVGGVEIKRFATIVQAQSAVETGRVAGLILDAGTATVLVRRSNLRAVAQFPQSPYATVLETRKLPALTRAVDQAIGQLIDNGRLQAIQAREYPLLTVGTLR